MPTFDANAYGAAIASLLREPGLPGLAFGKPVESLRPRLQSLDAKTFEGRNPASVAACQAGLWLYFDFFEESHAISQDLSTPEGSYWHAILHRREPDAGNAKYWFRKVGTHPVLAQLAEESPSLGYKFTGAFAFVDFCERVRGTDSAEEETAKKVQRREWELLFDWCFQGER